MRGAIPEPGPQALKDREAKNIEPCMGSFLSRKTGRLIDVKGSQLCIAGVHLVDDEQARRDGATHLQQWIPGGLQLAAG